MLANAEHYALFCMRNSGRVTPALFLTGPDGASIFVPQSLRDAEAKEKKKPSTLTTSSCTAV